MKKYILFLTLFILAGTNSLLEAKVFVHNIRVTQPGSDLPFDGRFDDGTGAAIRFTLADRADSLFIRIFSGSTLVRTLADTGFSNVDTFYIWDGKNNSGQYVPSGNYTFEIKVWNAGYSTYKVVHYSTPAIYTRGVTTIKNVALKNFGFIYTADNGGYATGVARHAANGEMWGNAKGIPLLTTTGVPVGPSELRYSSEADNDGYIYLIGRTNRQIFRYHTDTLNVTMIDSGGYNTPIQGLAILGTGSNKYILVVGDTSIYGFPIGNNSSYFGPKSLLVSTNGAGITMMDAVVGRDADRSLYIPFYGSPDASTKPGIARIKLGATFGATKTFADTTWTMRVDTGRCPTAAIYYAEDPSNDVVYFVQSRIASGNVFPQGIWALKNIYTSTPSKELAYQDVQNNITPIRADVAVDAVGNFVFFENSNEEVVIVSPPSGPNSFTTPALNPIKVINAESIAAVKVDANGDLQPDRLGQTVTVLGLVNSVNYTRSANRFSYVIQDATGGITITKGSVTGGGPYYSVGTRLLVTGTVSYFRGTTQLDIADLANDISVVDSGNVITPVELTLNDYLAEAERYEGVLIKFNGVAKTPSSPAWPTPPGDANMIVWDGYKQVVLRVDKDTDLDENPEPNWPISVIGTGTQYTSSSTVHNDGYQITPNFYADITGGLAVPPSKYFFLNTPANNATIVVTDSNQTATARWTKSVDLNGDPVIYQFMLLTSPQITSGVLNDTFYTFDGRRMLQWLGTRDTLKTKWTVRAKGNEANLVTSVDTFNITFIKNLPVGIKENTVPEVFYLDQNFPNPFNPSTSIRFGLPNESIVDLKVYNILGQEVASLLNGELMKAGNHEVKFNAGKLTSGTYIYKLTSGDQVYTRKMLLIK